MIAAPRFSIWIFRPIAILLGLSLFLVSCSTVPVTERKGLHLVPDSEITTMSYQEYSNVIKKSKLSTDMTKVSMVRRVGQRIAVASEELLVETGRGSDIRNYKWEFNVIEDDKTVNAWCMPGGKVAVYTGLLPYSQDENGLAVVMGHEVAHAIAKHGNERMSQGLLAQFGAIGLSLALSGSPGVSSDIFMQAYGVGTQVGVLLPYSRVQESEADHIGLILMAKAGYDPRGAITLWQRMNAKGGSRPPEFLSTHPAPESRIRDIQSQIPEAMNYYKVRR
ncbi:MAG TPA: M48 family metallopeptidase [Syntrophales bacterium]|nr:M48 family metallopeptidase [Syntrophales bacterium]